MPRRGKGRVRVGARAKNVYGKSEGEAHVGEKIRAHVEGGQGRGTHVWEKGKVRVGARAKHVYGKGETHGGKSSGHVWRAGKGEARIGRVQRTCGGRGRTRLEARADGRSTCGGNCETYKGVRVEHV